MSVTPPVPHNEMERIISLSEFDFDYSGMQDNFKDLTRLAAKVAGTEVSLVNLIDTFTQWTVSSFGLTIEQMPREDSVCQYTITTENPSFEVRDLSSDERFRDKFYVKDDPKLRYYFGIPLTIGNDFNIGALCVMDKVGKEISPEKVELLKIIADEVVNRFVTMKAIANLKQEVKEANDTRRKVAHDIRGPLGGIINLAQMISMQGDQNKMDEVLEFIKLIQKSGTSLLDLADEILSSPKRVDDPVQPIRENELNLDGFKQKLEQLYLPQAVNKKIDFSVRTAGRNTEKPFLKNKLLQIAGNLISNAIKFTPDNGKVSVELDLIPESKYYLLRIVVTDTGIGMPPETLELVRSGGAPSSDGTKGEQGYGFGLSLVKRLVDSLGGTMKVESEPGKGTRFEIVLHQA